jgi:hypothetical protein
MMNTIDGDRSRNIIEELILAIPFISVHYALSQSFFEAFGDHNLTYEVDR